MVWLFGLKLPGYPYGIQAVWDGETGKKQGPAGKVFFLRAIYKVTRNLSRLHTYLYPSKLPEQAVPVLFQEKWAKCRRQSPGAARAAGVFSG
jgi:hypothetical protein